jgi:hypothetical protein
MGWTSIHSWWISNLDYSDEIHSTQALSGGRIYLRMRGSVYCFGVK